MKLLMPVFFLVIAGTIFFWYINPTYTSIQASLAKESQYDNALTRARDLETVRDQLLARYNTFSPNDINRLNKLLPDHVDNVRLILDLDSMASKYGMRVRNVSIQADSSSQNPDQIGGGDQGYESMDISFTVSGTYDTFRNYLTDLEQSLRLVDVVGLTFTTNDTGVYDFTLNVRTYWLKPDANTTAASGAATAS